MNIIEPTHANMKQQVGLGHPFVATSPRRSAILPNRFGGGDANRFAEASMGGCNAPRLFKEMSTEEY